MSKTEEEAAKHAQAVAETAKKAPVRKHSQGAAMPVKKPRETPPSTVRGKIEAIQKEMEAIQIKRGTIEEGAAEIHAGMQLMVASINKQIGKYKGAIADFYASVGYFNDSIRAQSKENEAGIKAMQSSIGDMIKENAEYVKNFYG